VGALTQVNENRASQSEMKGRPNRSEVRPRSVWAACMATPIAKLGGIVGRADAFCIEPDQWRGGYFPAHGTNASQGLNFAA